MKNLLSGIIYGMLVIVSISSLHAKQKSAFADKPCDSYCGKVGLDGKPLLWGNAPFTDFGSRPVKFNQKGVRKINQIPKPGVHPRIFFTPEDLPDIRKRLKETQCGQNAWKNLLCWTEMIKGNYDDQADYTKPDTWNGSFGGLHGRVPLFRLNAPREKGKPNYNKNEKAAELYQALKSGKATDLPPFYWNVFALEAFRCLIEDDKSGAETLAKVVITALKIDQAKRDEKRKKKKETTPPAQPVGAFQLSFIYDFIYNWLTPAQRKAIHDELAATTWSHDNYGTFNEATSARSNWATFSYWLLETLGIEGEDGFNDLKIRGMYRGWRNMLTYGWFQSGAVFEGEAKSQIGMDGVIPLAMREKKYGFENLSGHPYVQAYAKIFLPHSVNPMQTGFIKYDLLGGSHGRPMPMDTLGLKYMFPNDKIIDWLFRCAIGEKYENVPDRPDGYRNDLLFALIFSTDFDPANNDPAKFGLGNTFFCGERALMMTRSSWNKDAMMLNMHTRQANGGHPFSDRNSIMLAGAGRIWSPTGYASFRTSENSTVCIDGKSQQESTPGRMLDFIDTPDATFAVGDAKYCWDWSWRSLGKQGGFYTLADVRAGKVEIPPNCEPVTHTVNDFAFTKLPFAYLNKPIFETPSWIQPKGAISPIVREPNFPVKKAFRTAGLVRGEHPYTMLVDDIRKDDSVHRYDWTLRIEYDIQIAKLANNPDGTMDIVLTGNDPKQDQKRPKEPLFPMIAADTVIPAGQPMLLVKVLNRNLDKSKPAANPEIVELDNLANPKKYGNIRRLVIPADAVSPDFKVLLYAYKQGEPVPDIAWDKNRKTVTVKIGGQQDTITFSPSTSGKTDIAISRQAADGKDRKIITVNKTVPVLKDELLEKRVKEEAKIKSLVKKELADFNPAKLDGVAGHWDFENISNGMIVNAENPLMNIEYTGAELVPGRVGKALKCTGTKEGIALPLVDLSEFGPQGVTVAFWTLSPEKKDGTFLANNGNRGISLGSEHQRFLRTDTNWQWRWKNLPMFFPAWHHIAWSYDGKTMRLYVDGKETHSGNADKPLNFSRETVIGRNFTGLIDELLIYKRVLSPDEIQKIVAVQTYGPGTK